ncbi:hypothetical protein Q4595_10870 [Wenyingzhuangia sp. 1_MG-2023]|nr:hypothetical protein [Wenyingzhuangia sp. 1_MG-2023]
MTEETRTFINNWETKLSEISGDDLASTYDKFNTLYTISNRLQREVFVKLQNKGVLTKARYSDYEKATSLIIEYLESQTIIDRLLMENNTTDIEQISDLIRNKVFNINLADGVPQEEKDEQLAENLINVDNGIKSKAVLSVIYNVRCNMVHGHKDFENYQSLLVVPLSNILNTINNLLKEKLSE